MSERSDERVGWDGQAREVAGSDLYPSVLYRGFESILVCLCRRRRRELVIELDTLLAINIDQTASV